MAPSISARLLPALLLLATTITARAQEPQALPALPPDTRYDPAVSHPASVLGFDVGTWHVRPDLLVDVFEALAATSDRVTLSTYGLTHEDRPLLLAAISSPENLARLEEIRAAHIEAVTTGSAPPADQPVIVWMGYSVHGNEPSGANASMLVAYHLAAALDGEVPGWLDEAVVLIDPCINPDGLARFAHWANTHKGRQLVSAPYHREHTEAWPGGRTNHYWFDLNRDWLLLTHPESQGRIEQFHRWRPHVLTDHHEMGTGSTFFFQPGIPSRTNPNTPSRNLELTRALARFHADALDEAGRLYYSEESFDDFYYGKGSTYPDVHGAIGILFEQASSRGHLQENDAGPLPFGLTIQNQLLTSLSTLRGAVALRDELVAYQVACVRSGLDEAGDDGVAGWVFGSAGDTRRAAELIRILLAHRIEVRPLGSDLELDGEAYDGSGGAAWIVEARQPQARLARAVFEQRTTFPDPTFYDVSAWTLPLAFGLPSAELGPADLAAAQVGEPLAAVPAEDATSHALTSARRLGEVLADRDTPPYAWLLSWESAHAPRGLQRLLAAGARAWVSTRRFTATTMDAGVREFEEGTLVLPTGVQDLPQEELEALIVELGREHGMEAFATATGLTAAGVDLGSPSLTALREPVPLLLVGDGVSSYEAGEVWHELDARWGVPVTMVDTDDLGRVPLHDMTHVILVGGRWSSLDDEDIERLKDWTRSGGVLVGSRGGASWITRTFHANSAADARPDPESPPPGPDGEDPEADPRPAYGAYEARQALDLVAGTIFETRLDLTHPLAFGYRRERLPVFRRGTEVLQPDTDPFANVALYTDDPLLAGYASDENAAAIAGTAAVIAKRFGRGTTVRLADDPVFRGFWWGTSRLLANALFFGHAVKYTSDLDEAAAEEFDEH